MGNKITAALSKVQLDPIAIKNALTPQQRKGLSILLGVFLLLCVAFNYINKPRHVNTTSKVVTPVTVINTVEPDVKLVSITDKDGLFRTPTYYKAHPAELKLKLSECTLNPQSPPGYQNCLNAEKAQGINNGN